MANVSLNERPLPPGPVEGPSAAMNAFRIGKDRDLFIKELFSLYGDIFSFSVMDQRVVFICHPRYIKSVFLDQMHLIHKPEIQHVSNRGHYGDATTSLEGDEWKKRRRAVHGAFHRDTFTGFSSIIKQFTKEMIDSWEPNSVIDLHEEFLHLRVRLSLRTILGADVEKSPGSARNPGAERDIILSDTPLVPYHEALGEPFNASIRTSTHTHTTNGRLRAGKEIPQLQAVIDARLKNRDSTRRDMIQSLVDYRDESGKALSDGEIKNEVLQMLYAGHHTIPVGLVGAFRMAHRYPEKTSGITGAANSDEAHGNAAQFIKESVRLLGPHSLLIRVADTDLSVGDYRIPTGYHIWTSPAMLHFDARFFPDPLSFEPERFAEQGRGIDPFAYIPFGAGPRVCAGNNLSIHEMAIVFCEVLKSVKLELQDIAPDTEELVPVGQRMFRVKLTQDKQK